MRNTKFLPAIIIAIVAIVATALGHVGHLRYLEAARALGDRLVVAINSDRAVRELKGVDRPITDENERAEILSSLRQVDYVTIFDDLSPRSLIASLLPDVLVKGGDYQLHEIHVAPTSC